MLADMQSSWLTSPLATIQRRTVDWSRPIAASFTAVAILLLVAGVLFARRTSGAAVKPLPLWLLLPTAAAGLAIIDVNRRIWRRERSAVAPHVDAAFGWLGTETLALLALGCSWPGTRLMDWLVWAPVIAVEQWRRRSGVEIEPATSSAPAESLSASQHELAPNPPAPPASAIAPDLPNTCAAPIDVDESLEDGDVLQRLVRMRDEHGVESVQGSAVAEFIPGQRHAIIHVGFCPPLARVPEIEAEPTDGPDARVKILGAYAHGVRLEVRLQEPARQPCRVTVGLAATPTE